MYIDITTDRFDELNKNHLFFLRLYTNIHYDEQGREQDYSKWQSIDRDLGISFDAGNFADRSLDYCLCVVDKGEQKKDDKGNDIEGMMVMYFHAASARDVNDWFLIFSDYSARAQNVEDKYSFLNLLWMLAKKSWSVQTIESCLRRYNHQSFPFFFSALGKVCRCLSQGKQIAIEELCKRLGGRYKVYVPPIVVQLHQSLFQKRIEDSNLFTLVDEIFDAPFQPEKVIPLVATNPLAAVYKWFHSEEGLSDYSVLRPVFSMLNENKRLDVVKRYFHDIRLGHTKIDFSIISQFKDNDFGEFIRYRYCIESPAEPIILTIPLLCDNIITLYNSKGSTFQTFDGVLDFAMTHCDMAHPAIKFKLERFIPVCDGGAVYNRGYFKGFIDYSTIRIIDESKLTDDNLVQTIKQLLDYYGERLTYPYCKHHETIVLTEENVKNCQKYDCLGYKYYDARWIVDYKYVDILNCFMKEPLKTFNQKIPVDGNMLSVEVFRQYIKNLPEKFISNGDGEFVVGSYKRSSQSVDLMLVEQYSLILRMRIFPQNGALVGQKFDVFGFWNNVEKAHGKSYYQMLDEERKQAMKEFEALEGEEVKKRTISSLKAELGKDISNNGYFEVAYDRNLLVKLIQKYYHKSSFSEGDHTYEHEFLVHSNPTTNFKPFCAPELAEKHNPSIDLPYFWCRGNECFHNCLGNQTLEKQHNWHEYSLYHMIEILGYPKIHETEAGYEPDPVVWKFIAITNKVAQKFKSLKCRSCGHMLFSAERVTGFNRYNYYGCINPSCSENRKLIYLNYCYSCKKGLIDSRDSKQCPNGWYICPTCLSCCDDAQYERLAQRYVLSGRPVPDHIESKRGHGHNDKKEFFCPTCGNPIEMITEENGNTYKGCKTCKRNFDKEAEEKDMYGYH